MSINKRAKIEIGFDLASLIVGANGVGRLVVVQVREGFAVCEYALQLHITEQLAQLFQWRHLRCTSRDLRGSRVNVDGAAQNRDQSKHPSRRRLAPAQWRVVGE